MNSRIGSPSIVLAVSFVALILTPALLAPEAKAQWAKSFDVPGHDDLFLSAEQTTDGGYVAVGMVYDDFLVVKLSASGGVEWQKTYGGAEAEAAQSVVQTPDGGYIVTGATVSFGAGGADLLVLKLSSSGTVEWAKVVGGPGDEGNSLPDWLAFRLPFTVRNASNGGYIVAGKTDSFGAGEDDWLLLKLSASGMVEWKKTFGSPDEDACVSLEPTADGGYIAAGDYGADTGDSRGLVLKLSSTGSIQWQKTYSDPYAINDIHQTSSGGYVAVGPAPGYDDFSILKLSSVGVVEWTKSLDMIESHQVRSVRQTADGGYVMAGSSASHAGQQVWYNIWKFNFVGEYEWERANGGGLHESLYSVRETSDGGFITVGITDTFGGSTFGDPFILKTDSNGLMPNCLGTLAAIGFTLDTTPSTAQTVSVTETTPALTVGVPTLTVTEVSLTEKTCPFYIPPPPGGCSGVAEASVSTQNAPNKRLGSWGALVCFLIPMVCMVMWTFWRIKN